MPENKKDTIWTGRFLLVILLTLFSGAAGQMTYPLVAKFSLTLNPDITLASTIAGLMSLMSLFVCPFAGLLSDRVSRKRILQISSICYGIVLIMHAFVKNIPMLIALRLLVGVFFSINGVTSIAFSTSFIPESRIGEGLGYAALANILAQAVGPAIGLKLVEISGYPATFFCAGLSAFFCCVVITLLPYKEPEKKPSASKSIKLENLVAVEFIGFMLLAALFSSGNGMITTYLAIIAEERAIPNIALFFTLYSVCMVVLRPFTGRLLDKKGAYFILVPAVLFAALGMVLVGIGYSLSAMLVASVFKALGQGAGVPSLQASVIKKLDKSRAGVATSTIQIGQNIGNALAPMAGSFFVKSFGYEKMFCGFAAFLAVCGLLILYLQYRKEQQA